MSFIAPNVNPKNTRRSTKLNGENMKTIIFFKNYNDIKLTINIEN